MNRWNRPAGLLAALTLAGCSPPAADTSARKGEVAETPDVDGPNYPAPITPTEAIITSDTDRDRPFADFVREESGGMVAKAAVGIAEGGMLRLDLDRSAQPEEVLPMASKLVARARRDFPDRPVMLAIFDPGRRPILKARWRPGQGVRYMIVPDRPAKPTDEAPGPAPPARKGVAMAGLTEADRAFADQVGGMGSNSLRYVEADIARHRRVWIGVDASVKAEDVGSAATAVLGAAREAFPPGELQLIVFGPDGQVLGRSTRESAGSLTYDVYRSEPPR